MDIAVLTNMLGIDANSDERAVLDHIQALRDAALEEGKTLEGDSPDMALLKANEHPQCSVNADGSVLVTLAAPIKVGKDETTELTLRRPKMKDIRVASEKGGSGGASYVVQMICALSGQAPRVVDELDVDDVGVLSTVVGFLSLRRRPTGA